MSGLARAMGRSMGRAMGRAIAGPVTGVPEYMTIDGVLAHLLKGNDNQPIQGRDGQYLYGRAS